MHLPLRYGAFLRRPPSLVALGVDKMGQQRHFPSPSLALSVSLETRFTKLPLPVPRGARALHESCVAVDPYRHIHALHFSLLIPIFPLTGPRARSLLLPACLSSSNRCHLHHPCLRLPPSSTRTKSLHWPRPTPACPPPPPLHHLRLRPRVGASWPWPACCPFG